jgi:P-type Cu+ transporter
MATHQDPVCGMQVEQQKAAGQTEHQGQTYYFCSQGCQQKFEQNPQQYAHSSGQAQSGAASR